MYLEKKAVEYTKNVNISKLFSRIFVTETGQNFINRKGSANDFLEYKEYTPGDDIRKVDWKVFAKTEKLFTKTFRTEFDKSILILLDISKSMISGDVLSKVEYSKFLVSLVVFKLLNEKYQVGIATFNDKIRDFFYVTYNSFSYFDVYLSNLNISDISNFEKVFSSLKGFSGKFRNVLILSDLLFVEKKDFVILKHLFKNSMFSVFQILSQKELDLNLSGILDLVEPESMVRKITYLNRNSVEMYHEKIKNFITTIRNCAIENSFNYVLFRTTDVYYKRLYEVLI